MPSLEVLSRDDQRISVKLKGVPLQYANALRRICLNGVPVFAIDTVDIIENSSVLADEGLAHRLGLVPLKTDLSEFEDLSQIDTADPDGRVMLTLDSGDVRETRTVFSGEIASGDGYVKPVSDNIPLVELVPNQRIRIEAYARLGRGLEHAKWNSANIAVLVETEKEGERILTVESTGSIEPGQIVMAGISELANRLAQFKGALAEL